MTAIGCRGTLICRIAQLRVVTLARHTGTAAAREIGNACVTNVISCG